MGGFLSVVCRVFDKPPKDKKSSYSGMSNTVLHTTVTRYWMPHKEAVHCYFYKDIYYGVERYCRFNLNCLSPDESFSLSSLCCFINPSTCFLSSISMEIVVKKVKLLIVSFQ